MRVESEHSRQLHNTFDESVAPLVNELEWRGVHVISSREGGLVECWVPFDAIDDEEVAVKEDWVDSLSAQMERTAVQDGGGSGQQTPVSLGLIEGEPLLMIADGFHRTASLQRQGQKGLYATVKQTDWNELYDFRIFTAKDHAHVRISRVVQWITEVWQHSGLADKLNVDQAVLLYRFDNDGSKLRLDPEDVQAAKEWVRRKEQQWDMAAMTIHNHLKVAINVDPKLVHSTREKRSGNKLDAPTQSILSVFSDYLPKRHDLQNAAMEEAKLHNLTRADVAALCQHIKDCRNAEEAQQLIEQIDWEVWEPKYGDTKQRALRRAYDPRYKGAKLLNEAITDMSKMIQRIDQSFERNEVDTPDMADNVQEAEDRLHDLEEMAGKLAIKLSQLRSRIQNTAAPKTSGNMNNNSDNAATNGNSANQVKLHIVNTPPPNPAPVENARMSNGSAAAQSAVRPVDTKPVKTRQAPVRDIFERQENPIIKRTTRPTVPVRAENTPPPPSQNSSEYESPQVKINRLVTAYANELSDELPAIKSRLDAKLAQEALERGNFFGHPARQDDIREAIEDFKRWRRRGL